MLPERRQQGDGDRQDNRRDHTKGDPRRRSCSRRLRRIRLPEPDVQKDGDGKSDLPEHDDPRRRVDPRAQQAVQGEGARKGEGVRDEEQGREDIDRAQNRQGPRPEDGGLGVEHDRGRELAEHHDGVDHGDEPIDLGQSKVAQRQDQREGREQAGDDEAEPDLRPGRRRIKQP